jgi:hypothetical protein
MVKGMFSSILKKTPRPLFMHMLHADWVTMLFKYRLLHWFKISRTNLHCHLQNQNPRCSSQTWKMWWQDHSEYHQGNLWLYHQSERNKQRGKVHIRIDECRKSSFFSFRSVSLNQVTDWTKKINYVWLEKELRTQFVFYIIFYVQGRSIFLLIEVYWTHNSLDTFLWMSTKYCKL